MGSGTKAQRLRQSPNQIFWARISLDLAGAILLGGEFSRLSVVEATFTGATFLGYADFKHATFVDSAIFTRATFKGDASFEWASSTGYAGFHWTAFSRDATFRRATFSGFGSFYGTTFTRDATFDGATVFGTNEERLRDWDWPAGWKVLPLPPVPRRGVQGFLVEDPGPTEASPTEDDARPPGGSL